MTKTAVAALVLFCATPVVPAERRVLKPSGVSEGVQTFTVTVCRSHSLSLELPVGYDVSEARYRGFSNYIVTKKDVPSAEASLLVTVTRNPNVAPVISPEPESATIAGQKVWWNSWTEERGAVHVYHREVLLLGLFPLVSGRPQCSDGIRVIIAATGTNVDQVRLVAGAVSLKPIARPGL